MIGVIIPAKDEEKNILDVIVNIHEAGIEKNISMLLIIAQRMEQPILLKNSV